MKRLKVRHFGSERFKEFTSCTSFLRKLLKDILQENKEVEGSRGKGTNMRERQTDIPGNSERKCQESQQLCGRREGFGKTTELINYLIDVTT